MICYINDASFIYQDIVDAKANLKLDLNSLKIEGTSQINKILVKDSKNSKILNITNINSDIFMDFSKNVNIELKDLKIKII